MTNSSVTEPRVHLESCLPKGYKFVRKGHVYITKNCRKLTQEAGQTVYVVEDHKGKQLGIRVPHSVYSQVLRLNAETKQTRAEAVLKKDSCLEKKVESELLRSFPKMPAKEVATVLKHTLKKRSGRVGRSKDVTMNEMVNLAVRAHVRHSCTNYDKLLARGINKEQARREVDDMINNTIEAWGGNCKQIRKKCAPFRRPKVKAVAKRLNKASKQKMRNPECRNTKPLRLIPAKSLPSPPILPRRRSLRLDELHQRQLTQPRTGHHGSGLKYTDQTPHPL